MRIVVVLPAPFGPSRPNTLPVGTSRSMPASASTSPNRFVRPSTRIASSGIWPVLGEERVKRAARVPEQGVGLRYLAGIADVADLGGRDRHLADLLEERADVVVRCADHLLPGRQVRAALLDVRATAVRQRVRPASVDLLHPNKAFVLELCERRVDRAGARPPDSAGALLELLHDLVAV